MYSLVCARWRRAGARGTVNGVSRRRILIAVAAVAAVAGAALVHRLITPVPT